MTQNFPMQPAQSRRRFATLFILLGVLLVGLFFVPELLAQDAADTATDAPKKKTALNYIG